MLEKFLVIILFCSIFVLGSVVSRLYTKYIIPKIAPWSIFDHKPFNCEVCFTTWFIVGFYICIGFLLSSWCFAILGTIVGIGNGLGILITDFERKIL